MTIQIEKLGRAKNVDVIRQFVDLSGKRVADIGCGGMTFTEILVELGANVLAIDPDPIQANKNRAIETPAAIKFVEAGANEIPSDDHSLDGCFFSYSLHHIPAEIYPSVFSEVVRVLKPDGFLYIIEPIDCPLNQVMRLFFDEDAERQAAQDAIMEIAAPNFEQISIVEYHDVRKYQSFDDFATQFAGKSFNSIYTEQDVRQAAVRDAFELHGKPNYEFTSPKRVAYLAGVKK